MLKLDGKTQNLISENITKLGEIFPEVIKEGKVNFEILRQILGDENLDDINQDYDFTWHGKSDAITLALKQSTGTLRPAKDESKDWDSTENLFIEGDNVEVLRILQASYRNTVKVIYIDPPYNTGNDFIYEDDFRDNVKHYKEKVQESLKANPKTAGRYHTDWLNMIYPRLRLARNLLREDGVIFISIDDNEVHNLRKVCDEIFGEENFVESFIIRSNPRGNQAKKHTASEHEYVLCFAKQLQKLSPLGYQKSEDLFKNTDDDGNNFSETGLRKRGADSLREDAPNQYFPIYYNPDTKFIDIKQNSSDDIEILPKLSNGQDGRWRWSKETVVTDREKLHVRLVRGQSGSRYDIFVKEYESDQKITKIKSILYGKEFNYENATEEMKLLMDGLSIFDYSKPVVFIEKLLEAVQDPESLVLDFFAGSGTTAHAVMKLNAQDDGKRKFILVQIPESTPEDSDAYKADYKRITDIGKERISRAGEKLKRESQVNSQTLDIGFKVFKLDETNFTQWDEETKDPEQALLKSIQALKPNRTQEDAVYEILLKYDIDITLSVTELEIQGNKIFWLASDALLICLEKNLSLTNIEEMITNLRPKRVVFYDDGFADDNVKLNAEQSLKKFGIEDIRVL